MPSAQGSVHVTRARKGEKGDTGAAGLVYRFTVWEAGKEYRNDADDVTLAERYVDVCAETALGLASDEDFRIYQCAKTHVSDGETNTFGKTGLWTTINTTRPLYSVLVLANKIKAAFIDVDSIATQGINIVNGDGRTVLTLKSGDKPITAYDTSGNEVFSVDKSGNVTVSGQVNATSGKIGNFSITDLWLQAKGDGYGMGFSAARFYQNGDQQETTATYPLLADYTTTHKTEVGLQCIPSAVSGGSGHHIATFTTSLTNTGSALIAYENTAVYASALGSSPYTINDGGLYGNFAFRAAAGKFAGLRPNVRVAGSDMALTSDDHTLIVTAKCTLTFPSSPEDGQEYVIHVTDTYDVTYNFGSKTCVRYGKSNGKTGTSQAHTNFKGIDVVVYSVQLGRWYMASFDSN